MKSPPINFRNRGGRYTQVINDPRRNWIQTGPKSVLAPKQISPIASAFGRVMNPDGHHISFSTPPRAAIEGLTTIRTNPVMPGSSKLHRVGLNVAPIPGSAYTQQYIKKLSVSLAGTFTDTVYYISGTIFWYMTSTNSTDQLLVRIGDITADQLPFGPGNGIEGLSFNKVYLTNNNATAGATATLVYFTDDPNAPARFF